ncbi:MAG: hypothetical protein Kow0069_37340 [Promethearchaeota archaeon]
MIVTGQQRRATVVFDTARGKTRKLAALIAGRLEKIGFEVKLVRDKEIAGPRDFEMADVLAVGSPAHFGGMAWTLRRALKRLRGVELKGKKFIAFATSASPTHHARVCGKIEAALRQFGAVPVTSIGCRGEPNEDVATAVELALDEDLL